MAYACDPDRSRGGWSMSRRQKPGARSGAIATG